MGVFAVYVSFFPQLVAGPIERSNHLLPQFFKKHDFNYLRVKAGFQKMLWGFFKKIVIADNLAILVDGVYNNVDNYSGLTLIVATIFFTFQIYCDFSGYSDIAIGTAKVMGFELRENFKRPYFSKSIREFWQRWHITLSTWFRDYVYIPLGGNKKVIGADVDYKTQGYYNYHYAIKDTSLNYLDVSSIEGTHYQTRNKYQIYVYYKNLNERFERLIGFAEELSKELF